MGGAGRQIQTPDVMSVRPAAAPGNLLFLVPLLAAWFLSVAAGDPRSAPRWPGQLATAGRPPDRFLCQPADSVRIGLRRFGPLRIEKYLCSYRQPEAGPPVWPPHQAPLAYVTHYKIWREPDNRLLLDVPGEVYGHPPPDSCRRIRYEDADFDGQPDLWIEKPEGNSFRFYGYRPWKDRFDTLFMSCLHDLERFPATCSAKGFLLTYGQPPTHPLRRVDFELQGPGLPIVRSSVTDLPPPPRTASDSLPTRVASSSFLERKAGFRYELGPIRPADQVAVPAEKGAYGQRVAIFADSADLLLHQHFIIGNTLRESEPPRSALQVEYINFDNVPDVRIPGRLGQPSVVLLSCVQPDQRLVFYRQPEMSRLEQLQRDTATHTVTGQYRLGFDRFLCRFTGTNADTLHRIRQPAYRPAAAQLDIFRFLCGRQVLLSSAPTTPVSLPPHREFADFNFDGFPDLRTMPADLPPDDPDSHWTYFLFDSSQQAFVRHEILSSLQSVRFEPDRRMLTGQVTVRTDPLHHTTTWYTMLAGQLVPTSSRFCRHPFPQSERTDCEEFIWVDGQWKWSRFLPGAD
ncbi:MAG: hypothetical protein RLY31_3028 [Bacteroidota bacterium]